MSDVGSVFPTEGSEYFLCTDGWTLVAPTRRFDDAVVTMCNDPTIELGCWQTVLLIDGNVGLGGDPQRILGRAAELLACGGRCVAEFDAEGIGLRAGWITLESARQVGPWFRWASVGLDSAAMLAREVGLRMTGVHLIGERVIADMAVF